MYRDNWYYNTVLLIPILVVLLVKYILLRQNNLVEVGSLTHTMETTKNTFQHWGTIRDTTFIIRALFSVITVLCYMLDINTYANIIYLLQIYFELDYNLK